MKEFAGGGLNAGKHTQQKYILIVSENPTEVLSFFPAKVLDFDIGTLNTAFIFLEDLIIQFK